MELENKYNIYTLDGKYHRLDESNLVTLPAIVDMYKTEYYYKYGMLHRDNGPAIKYSVINYGNPIYDWNSLTNSGNPGYIQKQDEYYYEGKKYDAFNYYILIAKMGLINKYELNDKKQYVTKNQYGYHSYNGLPSLISSNKIKWHYNNELQSDLYDYHTITFNKNKNCVTYYYDIDDNESIIRTNTNEPPTKIKYFYDHTIYYWQSENNEYHRLTGEPAIIYEYQTHTYSIYCINGVKYNYSDYIDILKNNYVNYYNKFINFNNIIIQYQQNTNENTSDMILV